MSNTAAGCWTCRIRHRKCDETRPAPCRECGTRGLNCHGYGPRPEWMNDDVQLRAELSNIKKAVKENFRRTRRLQANKHSRAHQSTQGASTDSGLSRSATPVARPQGESILSQEASYRESELSAYYLDYLFPFLYPFYKCDPTKGGRGWLFWLLSHNEPLRRAAISVAALHQRASSKPEDRADETELLEYHTSALSGLRQALCVTGERYLTDDPDEFIKLLACGCSLISFEVCQGGSNQWQAHLDALVSVACEITPETFAAATLRSSTEAARNDAATNLRHGRRKALEFLMAQVLWFELLASASSGAEPRMPYKTWLNSGCVNMVDVMGCENWIMEAIGDISTLDALNRRRGSGDLYQRSIDIEQRLHDGIESLESLRVRASSRPIAISADFIDQSTLTTPHHVTLIFANAALVYLSASVQTETSCPAALAQTIIALGQAPDTLPLRGLVWPLAIAGSFANKNKDQQRQIRIFMDRTATQANTSFGNCGPVARLLEYCWENEVGWRAAMAATGDYVLLI